MKTFPLTAAVFEGSLIIFAGVLGWFLKTPPLETFSFSLAALAFGAVSTLPPLGLLWLCLKIRWEPFLEISRIIDELIIPLFRNCSWWELAIIALLAGAGEEMLFRGVIQAAVAQEIGGLHGTWLGLLISSMLFGLLHPLTPVYALLAGLIGFYLGGLWLFGGNLLIPITGHALYDFLALTYFLHRRARREAVCNTSAEIKVREVSSAAEKE